MDDRWRTVNVVAPSANSVRLWIITLLSLAVGPGSVTILGPYLLGAYASGTRSGGWRVLGIAMIAAGAFMVLRCDFDFVTSGQGTPAPPAAPVYLVTNKLYRWTRNPMYAGVLLVLSGEAALFGNIALPVYLAVAGLGFHLFVTLYEEPHLTRTFGQSYLNYCAQVPRWLPNRINRNL